MSIDTSERVASHIFHKEAPLESCAHGWIEVLAGGMFSGKSEELLRRMRRAQIAKRQLQMFKPDIDNRFDTHSVTSHIKNELPATPIPINFPGIIFEKLQPNIKIVGIDEVQFFSKGIVSVAMKLADSGIRVVCAGLNQDSSGEPFGPMPHLMAVADEVTVLSAICTTCGAVATKSQKLLSSGTEVEVGAADKYAARCRQHWHPVK